MGHKAIYYFCKSCFRYLQEFCIRCFNKICCGNHCSNVLFSQWLFNVFKYFRYWLFNVNKCTLLWKCSLENQNEILEIQSNFTSFGFIHNVYKSSGYLIFINLDLFHCRIDQKFKNSGALYVSSLVWLIQKHLLPLMQKKLRWFPIMVHILSTYAAMAREILKFSVSSYFHLF